MTESPSFENPTPVCPRCGRHEFLEVGYVFRPATGVMLRSIWQCSRAYEGWAGCGWSGPAPQRVRTSDPQRKQPITGIVVEGFTDAQRDLQSSGDVILIAHPDGQNEVVI